MRVLSPLRQPGRANPQFRAGRLGTRVHCRAEDEAGRLVSSLNARTVAAASRRTLENDVEDKVRDLSRANATLALLFDCSRRIATVQPDAEFLYDLIRRFEEQLPGFQLTLCLYAAGEVWLRRSTEAPASCDACKPDPGLHSYEVHSQGQTLGLLRARCLEARPPLPWEAELIRALADLIGTSVMLRRQRERDNRLLLLDERHTIARELHDSLAQSLSYLKLQVGCVQTLLQRDSTPAQLAAALEEVRSGVNDAYRQLRELLTTFRLRVKEGNILMAVQESVEDVAARTGLRIHFRSSVQALPLSASEQIHLLHILREALANCARHAQAGQVWVYLLLENDEMELRVEDDGIGVPAAYDRNQHYGITMMQERARCVNGALQVENLQPRGTRVRLRFQPGLPTRPPGAGALRSGASL